MTIEELVGQLAETAQEGPIACDEAGIYRLDLNGQLVAFMAQNDGHDLFVWSELGRAPEVGTEEFYRKLLEAMFLDGGTGGATFCMDAETGVIYLQRRESMAEMDLEAFCRVVVGFGDILKTWREFRTKFEPTRRASDGGLDGMIRG